MLSKPKLGLFHARTTRPDDAPEFRRVIRFDKMSELVHDHVVYDEHRGLDETPVEMNGVSRCAGAPAVTIVDDLSSGKLHTQCKRRAAEHEAGSFR